MGDWQTVQPGFLPATAPSVAKSRGDSFSTGASGVHPAMLSKLFGGGAEAGEAAAGGEAIAEAAPLVAAL